ncbi:MAG: flagellar basal body rod protein FlgB [Pseudomonadota bacterium]
MNTDPIFGPHAAALGVWRQRNEILAANIANADTPNYKARDLDFKTLLAERHAATSGPRVNMITTHKDHLSPTRSWSTDLMYRLPMQPALDGNTVEADVEQAEFASNALRYQASLRFLNGRVSSLKAAIAGTHNR